jgi:hypothetical protein
MADIGIDTSSLTYSQFKIPGQTEEFIDGASTPTVSLPPGSYGFEMAGVRPDFRFQVTEAGLVDFDSAHDRFLSGRGTSTLVVRGFKFILDSKLSHGLAPFMKFGSLLEAGRIHELTLVPVKASLPAEGGLGYGFFPASGVTSDFRFGVTNDGQLTMAPEFGGFAHARGPDGRTLVIEGFKVLIDIRLLSHGLVTLNGATGNKLLAAGEIHEFTYLPAQGYGFHPASGINPDFRFGVTNDGQLTIAPEFGGFAHARGRDGRTLVIEGFKVRIDLRRLPHKLQTSNGPTGDKLFTEGQVHEFTYLPAQGYRFQLPTGAPLEFLLGITNDGQLTIAPEFRGFAHAEGRTLVLRGYPIVIDAAHADSDLVGIANLGLTPQSPRELSTVLLPARNYIPQTINGVFATAFNIERDGTITFDPAAAGRYVVKRSSSPNPSKVGEQVTVNVSVHPVPPGQGTPQGALTFTDQGTILGSAPLDPHGDATFRTSALPPGDHDIAIDYPGNEQFQPSSALIRHQLLMEILWPQQVISAVGPGAENARNLLGDPDGQVHVMIFGLEEPGVPGMRATVGQFRGRHYPNLLQLVGPGKVLPCGDGIPCGDFLSRDDLARVDVIAFERNGSTPETGGGWEGCDWTFTDGATTISVSWDGQAGAPRDPHVVANGSILGSQYKQYFDVTRGDPIPDGEVISFLIFSLPELRTEDPDFAVEVKPHAPGGSPNMPDIDAIGLIPRSGVR